MDKVNVMVFTLRKTMLIRYIMNLEFYKYSINCAVSKILKETTPQHTEIPLSPFILRDNIRSPKY